MGRLRRTASYVSTVTFGTHAEAEAAADVVRGVHRHVHGTDPVTGRRYSASDPATMVWVHCVEVHSFLPPTGPTPGPSAAPTRTATSPSRSRPPCCSGPPGRVCPTRSTPTATTSPPSATSCAPRRGRRRHRLRAPALAADCRLPSGCCCSPPSAPWATRPRRWCPRRCASWPGLPARPARAAQPGRGVHGRQRGGRRAAHPGAAVRGRRAADPHPGNQAPPACAGRRLTGFRPPAPGWSTRRRRCRARPSGGRPRSAGPRSPSPAATPRCPDGRSR